MFDKILMPTDGSAYALQAAGYAADIGSKYGSEATLLYVAELPPVLGIAARERKQEHMRLDLLGHAKESLQKTLEVFEKAGVRAKEELIFGSAVPDILRYARDGGYDLLVIGSRGAGTAAVEQILIGSVAEGVVHAAPCPVLLVRAA